MIANLTKKDCIMIISKLPDPFIQQFFKIACYYNGFINSDKYLEDRSTYISKSNMAMMMLSNLLTTASNGVPIENQIVIDKDKSIESVAHALKFYEDRLISVEPEEPEKKPKKKSTRKPKKGEVKNGKTVKS